MTAPFKLVPKWMDGEFDFLKDSEAVMNAAAGGSGTAAGITSFLHVVRDAVGIVENLTETGD